MLPEELPVESAGAGSPLAQLQRQFVREILYRDSAGWPARIRTDGLSAERRMGIYRSTARENFARALESAFPLLLRCLGAEPFRQLAWAYQRACPSSAGSLFGAGRHLPDFLGRNLRTAADAYLVDVTRLEWLVQEAMVAADGADALDLAALAEVPAECQVDLRFHLHPSVRLLRTTYDVFPLWSALNAGQAIPAAERAATCLLILRRAAGVELQRVPPADMAWLEAVQGGATLAAASGILPGADQDTLGALLVRWVSSGVVTSFD